MRRLHPATILVSILPKLREVVQLAVPLIVAAYAGGRHSGSPDWIAPAIGMFVGIFAIGAYWTTRFDIEPDHLVHTTGWIFKRDRRIPLKQVQNVSLRQNILERALGVATVDVETAMGKGRDLKLSVLKLDEAERFREEILEAAHLDAGLAPQAVPTPDTHVVTLNKHDLLLGAITENHIGQIIIGLFLIGGFGLGLVAKFTVNMGTVAAGLVYAVAGIITIIGLWFWGAVNYFLRFGDFTVQRNERVFRITYGLVNKVQMAVRPERIEYLRLTTTLFQRWMMRSSLHVGTASTFGEAGVLAPVALFVDTHRAYDSADEVISGLDIPTVQWRSFHWYLYRAATVRAVITILIATLAARLITTNVHGHSGTIIWSVAGLFCTLSAVGLLFLFLSLPENGFSLTEGAIAVRQGYFHQSISAIPIERIENIAVRQPFWWKKGGAVNLYVQAMKHHITIAAVPEAAVDDLLTRWHDKVQARDRKLALEYEAERALEAQATPEAPAPSTTE